MRVRPEQYYWIRYDFIPADGTRPYKILDIGLPYFDEDGQVAYWNTMGTSLCLDNYGIEVVAHIPKPE